MRAHPSRHHGVSRALSRVGLRRCADCSQDRVLLRKTANISIRVVRGADISTVRAPERSFELIQAVDATYGPVCERPGVCQLKSPILPTSPDKNRDHSTIFNTHQEEAKASIVTVLELLLTMWSPSK